MVDPDAAWLRLTYTASGNSHGLPRPPRDHEADLRGPSVVVSVPAGVPGWRTPRRVAKLYLPPGRNYFGSREAYELTYRSCQESGKYNGLFRRLAAEMGMDAASRAARAQAGSRTTNLCSHPISSRSPRQRRRLASGQYRKLRLLAMVKSNRLGIGPSIDNYGLLARPLVAAHRARLFCRCHPSAWPYPRHGCSRSCTTSRSSRPSSGVLAENFLPLLARFLFATELT